MKRILPMVSLLALLLVLLSGCFQSSSSSGTPKAVAGEGNVTLLLPEHFEYPDRKRFTKLTIDGKDFSKPLAKEKKVVKIDPKEGADSIEIVFSFWPVSYSNTIRTRVVKVKPGEQITVDLTKEDPAYPDKFEAIFFQTPQSLLDKMMKLAEVGKNDTVMDIGCGDGRLVITGVKKFGAKKGIGIDIRDELIDLCKENAKKDGVSEKTEFKVGDALKMESAAEASVVFLYLGEDLSAKLQPMLQKTLKPGSRVVSLDFPIGDWKPDATVKHKEKNNYGNLQTFTLHLWKIK